MTKGFGSTDRLLVLTGRQLTVYKRTIRVSRICESSIDQNALNIVF
jgi:hypothetical protein